MSDQKCVSASSVLFEPISVRGILDVSARGLLGSDVEEE